MRSASKKIRLGSLPGIGPVPRVENLALEASDPGFSIEQLRERACLSSAVLEEILKRHRPEPRWGINE